MHIEMLFSPPRACCTVVFQESDAHLGGGYFRQCGAQGRLFVVYGDYEYGQGGTFLVCACSEHAKKLDLEAIT